MSRAGVGRVLACLHPHAGWLGERGSANPEPVIGALVYTHTMHPWGALLMMHSDLDGETEQRWMHSDPEAPWSLRTLRHATCEHLRGESMRRREAVHHAECVLEARAMDLSLDVIKGFRGEQIVRAARSAVAAAREDDWPQGRGDLLAQIADSVIAELHADERCPACDGKGIMPHVLDELRRPVPCPACHGTTYTRWSDRERARTCGVTWAGWKRGWRRPYEWLYAQAMAARTGAVREFRAQLK